MFLPIASHACSGFCASCGLVHSLPSARAIPHCHVLMDELRKHERMDFDVSVQEADPCWSTLSLYSEMRGKMMGILVCEDGQGTEVILRAFSSKHNGAWNVGGWVGPLMNEADFNRVIEEGNAEIHPLTAFIPGLEKGTELWKRKTAERKAISRKVLEKLYALYKVHNFKNETRTLSASLIHAAGIPNGTGDCCAPKLLNHASRNRLKPISMAEFFWGRETASGHRVEGQFYPSCAEKCQPLLGFMLCGITEL